MQRPALPGQGGHPPVRRRRSRTSRRRRAGPPRCQPGRRVCAAGPGAEQEGRESLALDTASALDLRQLSTRELRAERNRLRGLLDQAPRDRARELARATARREQAEQTLAAARQSTGDRPTSHMLRWRDRDDRPTAQAGVVAVAEQQADRAVDQEQQLRGQQQRRAGWLEANAPSAPPTAT